ncbi:Rdx family-domain-containing protein [Echria macrotheca]|uniref:Rdx family-domain-containing protein n=1 Tax=Echria macrotheca TaxID=438768 RepID=A0AAJ0BDA2_9PEZI|nr:Rdx family-domain-containing protein [Echria macrotheca]
MSEITSPQQSGDVSGTSFSLPRVTIRFCTQCKWLLRAAYYAQELLSTFSTSLGEVALQPATGGVFTVEILSSAQTDPSSEGTETPTVQRKVLWDRKVDGGFPETKELKRRVRDVIQPDRNLGHVDRDYPRSASKDTPVTGEGVADGGKDTRKSKKDVTVSGSSGKASASASCAPGGKEKCEDCE